jgi:RNA polymerase-binding transcription factor DksA
MNTAQHKEALEKHLLQITEELKTIGIHNPENKSDWIAVPEHIDVNEADDNLAADAVEAWDERQGLVATFERDYNATIAALLRIENGTFGVCEVCRKEIEEARLLATPSARTCILHKEEEGRLG